MLRIAIAILFLTSSFVLHSMAKAEERPIVAEAKIEEKENPEKPKESTPEKPIPDTGLTWVFSKPAGIEFTKTEVTVAQYRTCVEAGKCIAPKSKDDEWNRNWKYSDRDNHPVNCVDWNQATAFCAWAGSRLPTEAEWKAEASNGGTRRFPWGDQDVTCDTAVWNYGCGKASTWPVCSKEKGNSVSGLCDMSGNVWEWTSTGSGNARVVCGGGWLAGYMGDFQSCCNHWGRDLTVGRDYSGFRCVRAAKP